VESESTVTVVLQSCRTVKLSVAKYVPSLSTAGVVSREPIVSIVPSISAAKCLMLLSQVIGVFCTMSTMGVGSGESTVSVVPKCIPALQLLPLEMEASYELTVDSKCNAAPSVGRCVEVEVSSFVQANSESKCNNISSASLDEASSMSTVQVVLPSSSSHSNNTTKTMDQTVVGEQRCQYQVIFGYQNSTSQQVYCQADASSMVHVNELHQDVTVASTTGVNLELAVTLTIQQFPGVGALLIPTVTITGVGDLEYTIAVESTTKSVSNPSLTSLTTGVHAGVGYEFFCPKCNDLKSAIRYPLSAPAAKPLIPEYIPVLLAGMESKMESKSSAKVVLLSPSVKREIKKLHGCGPKAGAVEMYINNLCGESSTKLVLCQVETNGQSATRVTSEPAAKAVLSNPSFLELSHPKYLPALSTERTDSESTANVVPLSLAMESKLEHAMHHQAEESVSNDTDTTTGVNPGSVEAAKSIKDLTLLTAGVDHESTATGVPLMSPFESSIPDYAVRSSPDNISDRRMSSSANISMKWLTSNGSQHQSYPYGSTSSGCSEPAVMEEPRQTLPTNSRSELRVCRGGSLIKTVCCA